MDSLDFTSLERKLQKSFSVKFYSQIYQNEFEGNFIVKKMSIGDNIKMGILKTQLLEGHCFDENTSKGVPRAIDQLCDMVAICQVLLIKKPDWFDPMRIQDPELLAAVVKEVETFEGSFRMAGEPEPSGLRKEGAEGVKEPDRSSSGGGQVQRSLPRRTAENQAVVGSEVPTVLKLGGV